MKKKIQYAWRVCYFAITFLCSLTALAQPATITFIVKDQQTGFAIPGAAIRVVSPTGKSSALTASQNGKVTFTATNGRYDFSITASGYKPITTWFASGSTTAIEANINLDPATNTASLRVAPQHTIISGYISNNDDNTALPGAQVTAGGLTTITDNKGFFSIQLPANTSIAPGVAPDKVTIQVTKAGYASYTIQNFYTIPDAYSLRIALSATEQKITKMHGLFDRTAADNEQRYSTPVPQARVGAILADTVPASIRVGTSCSCTSCTVVQVMSLEAYVQTGVDDEWISSWGAASLQAGAVAYRSYGAWYVLHPVNSSYDIAATTCNQAWESDQATSVKNAAIATAGVVLVKNHAIVRSEYSAENNNAGCGDGYCGTGTTWPCIQDERCLGRTKNGHGRGMCQWGSSFWASDKTYDWILNHYYNPGGVYIHVPGDTLLTATNDISEQADKSMKLSPNPITGNSVALDYTLTDATQAASLLLTDNYGKTILQRSVSLLKGNNHITIPVSGLKAGTYTITIRLNSTGKTNSQKLLVVK